MMIKSVGTIIAPSDNPGATGSQRNNDLTWKIMILPRPDIVQAAGACNPAMNTFGEYLTP